MNTLRDLVRRLKKYDEETVIELLDITSEDLVYRFEDKIEERFEEIEAFLDDEVEEIDFDDNNNEDY
jgi:hypothetical protein